MNTAALFAFNFLLNALWQIPLVWGAAWLAARLARRNGPQWEHRIWVGALLAELSLPLARLPFHVILQDISLLLLRGTPTASEGSVHVYTSAAAATAAALLIPPPVLALALAAWAAASIYFTARLFWKLRKTAALRRHAHAIAAEDYPILQNLLGAHPSPLELLVSQSVSGPSIIGIRRPALLLPPGFLDRTAPADLEAAFAHERAHLRRHDYAKNLLYEILALPIAWHPCVWLTRSRLTESREILCDHQAAQSAPSPRDYARALLRLASQQSRDTRQTVHAIGIFDTGSLERRIMQLTQSQTRNSLPRRILTLAACTLLAVATGASALALRVDASAASAHSKQTSAEAIHVSTRVMAGNRLAGGQFPKYPPEAKKKHIQGTVVVKAIISKQGDIESAHAVSGPKILREPAVKAIRTWRYKPYIHNGKPVAVSTTINIIYSLGGGPINSPNTAAIQQQLADAQAQLSAARANLNNPQLKRAKIQKQMAQAQENLQKALDALKKQAQANNTTGSGKP